MEMPKPTAAHHKLEMLVGRWSGEERLYPSPFDPAGGTALARIENRSVLDGFAVVHDYEQERSGSVNLRGHGVLRYDAMQQCYEMYWFDSMGMTPNVFRGNFEGEVLSLSCKDAQSHSRATFDLGVKGQYKFRMDVSPDGNQWFPFMEGQYTRKS
ncbi:DUF1579 family protein [candidate division KSB1 bacterium]|nr:DUF1579 family protein [candidate division KSB1 bacterium]